MQLHDPAIFIWGMFHCYEMVQGEGTRYSWNSVNNKRSEKEIQWLRETGIILYSYTSQLLMHHIVNGIGRLISVD